MEKHSLNIVAKFQECLFEDTNILVAYLGGSYARLLNDPLSDIDICLICHRVVSSEERQLFYRSVGVEETLKLDESSTKSASGVADSVLVHGIKVDINIIEFSVIKDLVQNSELIDCLSPHLGELFFALNAAEPFKGENILEELRSFIRGPTATQLGNAISQYLQLESRLDSLDKALAREDHLQINKLTTMLYERLYFTLTIVTGRYFPGFKRSRHYIQNFSLHSVMPGIELFWKMTDYEKAQFLRSSFAQTLLTGLVIKSA